MFLPYKENGTIKKEKILNYLLSDTHILGKNKAKFFNIIGFNKINYNYLEIELLKMKELEVKNIESNEFGTKYTIEGNISSPNGKIIL